MGRRTVLVIDDDPDISDFVQQALEDEGYAVCTAVGESAFTIAQESKPDFILLDIMMPGIDGVEMSQRFRNDPVTAAIPLVIMSAHTPRSAPEGLLCDGWLSKPFNLGELYAIIGRWTAATARTYKTPASPPSN